MFNERVSDQIRGESEFKADAGVVKLRDIDEQDEGQTEIAQTNIESDWSQLLPKSTDLGSMKELTADETLAKSDFITGEDAEWGDSDIWIP